MHNPQRFSDACRSPASHDSARVSPCLHLALPPLSYWNLGSQPCDTVYSSGSCVYRADPCPRSSHLASGRCSQPVANRRFRTREEPSSRQHCAFSITRSFSLLPAVAYVKYERPSSAALAVENLNGAVLNDGRGPKLKVLLADAPSARSVRHQWAISHVWHAFLCIGREDLPMIL
jgi:hypothetical protein